MTFALVFFHYVWTTKNRYPLITEENRSMLEQSVRATCNKHRVIVHALGFMPDHIHLAVSLPPVLSLFTFAQQVKGSSSHLINRIERSDSMSRNIFEWQSEYGVLTFNDDSYSDVTEYVENQLHHHTVGSIRSIFKQTEREEWLSRNSL